MGNLFSVSISMQDSLPGCKGGTALRAKYICEFEENIKALKEALEDLKDFRNDMKRKVEMGEGQPMEQLDQVQRWFSRAEAMELEVDQLIRDGTRETQKFCLGGCCSKNCLSSYKLGRKLVKKADDVATLRSTRLFDGLADRLPPPPVDERPSEPTVGFESTIDEVWSCLREEQVQIIGLYGMGGVGKTTLMTQVNNEFLKTIHQFDIVIWVVVSRDPNPEKVQDEIWKKVGFCDDKWKSKSQDEKAISIFRILGKKKFVLFLDDVWERFDLLKVGIPLPNQQNNSKLVFTTRSEEVCGRMGAHRRIKVECLAWKQAWDLFQNMVGEDTLNSHPEIPQLAETIVKECLGLPLALVTTGRTMACKKAPQEWKFAIKMLQSSSSSFPGMRDEVFSLLKFSYDNLPSDTARPCFLYCSLYPEDNDIFKEDLIDCWICEGFLDEFDDRDGARNQGFDIIGSLIRACLLEESREYFVKMHDVIRDMALWIACECGRVKDKFLVQAGAGLTELPEIGKWKGVERMSLMSNHIEKLTQVPTCPNLLTLFLNNNSLEVITDGFFQLMPRLQVLNLSWSRVSELPTEIFRLVSLRYLDLSWTCISHLPNEFKNLVNLKYLNLDYTQQLGIIPRHVVSSLSRLQVLKMFHCGFYGVGEDNVLSDGNEALVNELECLNNLCDLSITIRSASALQRCLCSEKIEGCTQDLFLQFFNGLNSLDISFLENMKRLDTLHISDCATLADLNINGTDEGQEILTSDNYLDNSKITSLKNFHSLRSVRIERCLMLKDLTWLVFAPNLVNLWIVFCRNIEQVIDSGKWVEAAEGRNMSPFAKLEDLILIDLPKLKSIYRNTLAFPCLKEVRVHCCPKLKKLPLNSNSAKGRGMVIYGEKDWRNELEWEDEAAHNAFLPCFRSW